MVLNEQRLFCLEITQIAQMSPQKPPDAPALQRLVSNDSQRN